MTNQTLLIKTLGHEAGRAIWKFLRALDDTDIAAAAALATAVASIDEVSASVTNISGAQTGTLRPWAGLLSKIPSGWLLCDGSAISRTTYATLFDKIGTLHGVGDGSTTFNLPDGRDRLFLGAPASTEGGTYAGSSTHTHSDHTYVPGVVGSATLTHNVVSGVGPHFTGQWIIKT